MTTAFHTKLYGTFIEIQSNLRRKNFIPQIKAPVFLEVLSTVEIMQEPQANLEEKDNPSPVSHRSDSNSDSEANSTCCNRPDSWLHLE